MLSQPPASRIRSLSGKGVIILRNCLRPVAAALWLLTAACFAAPNFTVQQWEAEHGLPQNTVTAVVQTRDGYLWLGTYSGLSRFDGVRFTVFDDSNTPGLASSRVTSLFEARDGTLWIGHETGGVTRYNQGKFQEVVLPSDWPGGKVQEIATDEAGDVWLLSAGGMLVRLRDGLVLTPETGSAANIASLARSPKGTIWVARSGRVSVLKGGRLTALGFTEIADNTAVMGIGASSSESVWIVGDGRIRKWTGDTWGEDRGLLPAGHVPAHKVVETRKGTLALGNSTRGCALLLPAESAPVIFNRASGFPSDWVVALCEDREGNLWAGTGGGGLAVIRRASFETVAPPDQWRGRAVLSVCATRDRSLWIGTEGAGLYQLFDGNWSNFSEKAGIVNPYVWSVAEDSRDGLWVGTWNSGLLLRRGDFFDRVDGIKGPIPHMTAILCSPRGGLWVGTGEGLMRYEGGTVTWFGQTNKPAHKDVRSVAEDNDGTIWFGTSGGGLGCLRADGTIRYFNRTDGLASDYVGCLKLEDDGTLWIGTLGGGLTRLRNGRFSVVNWKQGLPNGFICHIEDDGRGFYWMGSHGGIIRVNKAELNRCADGELKEVFFRTFGVTDGVPTLKCSDGLQPAGCRTMDGRLWFSTSRGLVTVMPREVESNLLPPPIVIETLHWNDQTIAAGPGHRPRIEIPPGRHRFEFRYTGLSFAGSDKMRFRYRLRGLDKEWVGAGNARAAYYSYVPPGNYTFEVEGCNSDGVWSQSAASVAFAIQPFFWQTWWFTAFSIAGSTAAAVAVGSFISRRRLRRKMARLEQQRAIEHERARIAHDIHDDLGAQLTRITMLSDSARDELADPESVAEDLTQIYNTARDATRAMDEIVWAVNPKHDTAESLASYLENFGFDFLDSAGIRCRLDFPGKLPPHRLTTEVRHNLFLAYKEALNNVVKHATATEVRITLGLQDGEMQLVVEDNGRGFVNGPANGAARASGRVADGNGLENMNRRVTEIGGTCGIHSEPGRGTKVIIRLKLPHLESS